MLGLAYGSTSLAHSAARFDAVSRAISHSRDRLATLVTWSRAVGQLHPRVPHDASSNSRAAHGKSPSPDRLFSRARQLGTPIGVRCQGGGAPNVDDS